MLVVLMLLVGYQLTSGPAVRAEMLPECAAVCDEDADAFEACEYGTQSGWVFTICGEYEGGSAQGYCDHATWDTCNYLCSYEGDEETECLLDGVESTCEAYGIYLSYNDCYCSPSEACGSSADCGACGPEMPPSTISAIESALSNQQIRTACEIATSAPYNYSTPWDCPSDEWVDEPEWEDQLCSVKNERLAKLNEVRRVLSGYTSVPGVSTLLELLGDIYDLWINRPCYLFID
jgi:hypothetical protein